MGADVALCRRKVKSQVTSWASRCTGYNAESAGSTVVIGPDGFLPMAHFRTSCSPSYTEILARRPLQFEPLIGVKITITVIVEASELRATSIYTFDTFDHEISSLSRKVHAWSIGKLVGCLLGTYVVK